LNTTFETTPCDLCGSTLTRPYLGVHDRIYDLPGEFQIVHCEQCGLLYINPRPNRASIGQYYPGLTYHAFRPDGGLKAALKRYMRQNEAKGLLEGLPGGAKVLEIGCGTGDLLVALREAGAEVMGVEPNADAAEAARSRSRLHVEIGMLDDVALESAQFDLVFMKYALEHVHSPRATIHQIANLLLPGGRAVFWIPNAASWDARLFGGYWRGLDAPRHLYIFTPTTIRELIATAGMQVQDITYSPVPNDWAGSFEFWLRDRGLPRTMARWFGVESPLALAAWLPFSAAAATFGAAGRMRVTVVRNP